MHQQSLGDGVGKAASALAQPAPPELQPAQRSAVQLAADLRLALARIAHAQHDPAALQALRGQFLAVRAQARQLANAR